MPRTFHCPTGSALGAALQLLPARCYGPRIIPRAGSPTGTVIPTRFRCTFVILTFVDTLSTGFRYAHCWSMFAVVDDLSLPGNILPYSPLSCIATGVGFTPPHPAFSFRILVYLFVPGYRFRCAMLPAPKVHCG